MGNGLTPCRWRLHSSGQVGIVYFGLVLLLAGLVCVPTRIVATSTINASSAVTADAAWRVQYQPSISIKRTTGNILKAVMVIAAAIAIAMSVVIIRFIRSFASRPETHR